MTNDFINYLIKYKINTSQELTTLEEDISFSGSDTQVDLYFDHSSITLDLLPFYKGVKYCEIEIELLEVSMEIHGNNIKNTGYQLGCSLTCIEMSNHCINLACVHDGSPINLSVSYAKFSMDYDKADCLPLPIIDYVNKLEKNNGLFLTLCELVDDSMLKYISEADYGNGAEKCFRTLKKIQQKKCYPNEADFNLIEVLELTSYGRPSTVAGKVKILFSSTILLSCDCSDEGPKEYWLIKLLSISTSKEQKKLLLAYYVNYLFSTNSHENPNLLLVLLIVTTMCFLDYPDKDIIFLLTDLDKTKYCTRYECCFIPDGTMLDFKSMLDLFPNNKHANKIYSMLELMFKKSA